MPGFGAHTALLGATLVAFVGLCLWRLWHVNQLMRRQRQLLQKVEAQHHEQSCRLQSLHKELVTQRQQAVEASRDSACVRKKNHEHQAFVKTLREELRDARRQVQEAQSSRPAFGEGGGRRVKGPAVTDAAQSVAPAAPTARKPAADSESPLAAAQLNLARLTEKLLLTQQSAAAAELEVKKLRRRSEDLRRIDIINRSKQELLQDKLHTMGRRYYDAISELAMLRGEVAPPPPVAEPTQSLFGAEDEAAAVALNLRLSGKTLDN
jgi:hypothetical protein